MDLSLPGLSGREIVAAVAGGDKQTKTVVLSGASDGETIYAALEAGAAGYLTKEIEPAAVWRSVPPFT